MKKLFDEYGIVFIVLMSSFIGIEIVVSLFNNLSFLEFVFEGVYGI